MPLIEVTYDGKVGEEVLRRLGEPSTGPVEPGDIEIRLSRLPLGQIGVWLILSEGAWSQSEN